VSLRLTALASFFALCAVCAAAQTSELIQPRIQRELNQAEQALQTSNFGLAEALSHLIRPGTIAVSIDLSRMPFDRRHECLRAADLALNMWQESLGGVVEFEVVPSSMAQVRIKFQPEVYVAGARAAGKAIITRGTVNWGWGSYGQHMSGTLEVSAQSVESMASTAAHEIGHVLGLADSGRQDGVMGAMLQPNVLKKPSSFECAALLDLYFQAEQVALRAQATRAS
jgi:hypothetical protein